jgi:quinohemoprotein ethanol dehydrogenase
VRRIADFMGVDLAPLELASVIRQSTFTHMQQIDGKFAPPRLRPWTKQRGSVIRRGERGSADELLTLAQQLRIDVHFRAELARLSCDFPYDEAFGTRTSERNIAKPLTAAPRIISAYFAGGLALLAVLAPHSPCAARTRTSAPADWRHSAVKDWPQVGRDSSNARYSPLDQINTKNVKQLGGAWLSPKFAEGGTSRVTPVVKDGLMFVTAGRQVYALNAKTGENVWVYATVSDARSADVALAPGQPKEAANAPMALPNARGVAIGEGLVFIGLLDGHVLALEEKTGKLVWSRQTGIDQPKKDQWVSAPTFINGVVFTGLSHGDTHPLRGQVTALDAKTGKVLWRHITIPGPGEPGHETWPSFNDTWKFGGGGVWTNPAVDPELSLVYFTTGNPLPAFAGDWRPGSNLYTSSVLAVDIRTGKLKWHYQLVHHDVFEGDAGTPVILYEATVEGRRRKALAVLRADGYLFQFDRRTGKPLFSVEERAVPQLESQKTSPTQPFPVDGESMLMSCEDWRKQIIPAGFRLGCMWTPPAAPPPTTDPPNVLAPYPSIRVVPMAYSPQTEFFYAQGTSLLSWPRRGQDPYFLDFGAAVPGLKAYEELAAIDSRTGKIVWRKQIPTSVARGLPAFRRGGPLATAGGLLIRSADAGLVEAYDARTGDALWQFQTGSSAASGSPASYEIDGEQHIAIPMGTAVWAFKLGGTLSATVGSPSPEQAEDFAGPLRDTAEIETTSLKRSLFGADARYFIDEYAFNPYRARVKARTKVKFVNNGSVRHELAALDGSWSTGPLSPTQEAWVSFDEVGAHTYICKDHPWTYGQIIVAVDAPAAERKPGSAGEQAMRGREQFDQHCGACHGIDLAGRDRAPALSGDVFTSRWRSAAADDLFDRIRTTMPQASPGSLQRQTYLDIVAYLLHANNMAAGK